MAEIAILHEVLGRSKGGIEAWIYHASEELVRQGHNVTLFHTLGNNLPPDAAPFKVKVISLNTKKVYPSLFFLRSVLSYKKQLSNKLEKFDYVWARSFGMAWAASQVWGNTKVIYINAAPYAYYAYRPLSLLLKQANGIKDILRAFSSQLSYVVAWFFEKNAIRLCHNVFLSKKRQEQTISFFKLNDSKEPYSVIPAGVDYNRFCPSVNSPFNDEFMRIISVSRLEKDKNIQCIIEAINHLIKQGKKIIYTVVGDGVYKNELIKIVKRYELEDVVHFVGKQSNVEKWYQKNDLFILPSLYEGFGSVYVEAMACGLPCIAISNKSGKYSVAADEIIDHGINGFLMSDNNSVELANYIKKFIDQSDLKKNFGSNAREKVMNQFTWNNTITKLLALKLK